jgi:hypothetical protein
VLVAQSLICAMRELSSNFKKIGQIHFMYSCSAKCFVHNFTNDLPFKICGKAKEAFLIELAEKQFTAALCTLLAQISHYLLLYNLKVTGINNFKFKSLMTDS